MANKMVNYSYSNENESDSKNEVVFLKNKNYMTLFDGSYI